MKTIKIFLASSEELKEERVEMADLVEKLNYSLNSRGLNIQLVKWEYMNSDLGPGHKQEDYNRELRECEMCVVIWWRNFGSYTKKELDLAYERRCVDGQNPQRLWVYFKDSDSLSDELREFRDTFTSKYGHFCGSFSNVDSLKYDFLCQFIIFQGVLLKENFVDVRDSKVTIDGKDFVDIRNIPSFVNNEEYQLLLKDIKKTKKLLSITSPNDSEYHEYEEDLRKLNERLGQMESSMWDTALLIAELSNKGCSDRLRHAIELFNEGDNRGAQAILDENVIKHDAKRNIKLILLGEEGKKGLEKNIDEILFKIRILLNERPTDWLNHVKSLYQQCVEYSRKLSDEKLAKILGEYGRFLMNHGNLCESAIVLQEALAIYQNDNTGIHNTIEHAAICGDLGSAFWGLEDFERSYEYHKDGLQLFKMNNAENTYQSVFISSYYAIDMAIIGKREEALKQIDYTFSLIEKSNEKNTYTMRLKINAITSKIKILLILSDFQNNNYIEELKRLLLEGLVECGRLKCFRGETIKIMFYLAAYEASVNVASIPLYPNNSVSYWDGMIHREFDRIRNDHDATTIFDYEIRFGLNECLFFMNTDIVKMRESYHNLYKLFVESLNQKMGVRKSHFDFLSFSLIIGWIDKDYRNVIEQSIRCIDDRWNVLPSHKEKLDFEIQIYHCLTSENNDDIKHLFDVYKNKFNMSVEKFLGICRVLLSVFLNNVCYYVLIPENRLEEALKLIEDSITLNPQNDNYWDSKAEILYRMGCLEEAMSLVFKVYKNDPEFYPEGNKYLIDELNKLSVWRKMLDKDNMLNNQ